MKIHFHFNIQVNDNYIVTSFNMDYANSFGYLSHGMAGKNVEFGISVRTFSHLREIVLFGGTFLQF